MKLFTILNLEMAKDYSTMKRINAQGKEFIFISIASPEAPDYEVCESPFNRETLYLRFHDVNTDGSVNSIFEVDTDNLVPFNASMAIEILDFVAKHDEEIDYVLINCEAGISRSAGVAMGLSEIYNGKQSAELFLTTLYDWKLYNLSIKEMVVNTNKTFRRR